MSQSDGSPGGQDLPQVPHVPEKTSRKERPKTARKVIGVGTVVVLVLLAVKLAFTFHLFDDHPDNPVVDGPSRSPMPTLPSPTFPRLVSPVPPTGPTLPTPGPAPTGGDPGWQSLALQCQHGSMRACDSLADQTRYANAPHYYHYGFTCGGRVVAATAGNNYVYCIDQFPKFP